MGEVVGGLRFYAREKLKGWMEGTSGKHPEVKEVKF
jgi:hypothetical protein